MDIPRDIVESGAHVKSAVLLSLGSFLFFMYVIMVSTDGLLQSTLDNTRGEAIYGASTQVANRATSSGFISADVRLDNAVQGGGGLQVLLEKPVNLVGVELYARIDGDLIVSDLLCSPQFECYMTQDGDTLEMVFFRTPLNALQNLGGTVSLGTLVYEKGTSAELVINDGSMPSSVLRVGSDLNMLSNSVKYLQVGRR